MNEEVFPSSANQGRDIGYTVTRTRHRQHRFEGKSLVLAFFAFTLRAGLVCRVTLPVPGTASQRIDHGRQRRGGGEGGGAPQRHVAVRPGDAGRGKFSDSRALFL